MKSGTRIEVFGYDAAMKRTIEPARIASMTAAMGTLPGGFHPVRFDADRALLLIHERNFRVTDNRA